MIPVTTQGLRSLDGIERFHNTPALIFADGSRFLHLWFRRWRRLFLRFVPTEQASSLRLGGSTEFFGQPERGQSRTALHNSREVGMRIYSGRTDQIRHSSSRYGTSAIWWRKCCHISERIR